VYTLACDDALREVRVTGATGSSLLISAVATGYFIYDSAVVLYHVRDDGAAYLAHGLLCMVCVRMCGWGGLCMVLCVCVHGWVGG